MSNLQTNQLNQFAESNQLVNSNNIMLELKNIIESYLKQNLNKKKGAKKFAPFFCLQAYGFVSLQAYGLMGF